MMKKETTMVSSVFKLFATSKELEKKGVWLDYGDVKFLVARAGGANHGYAELLKAKIRPIRHQVERDLLSAEENDRINAELFAEAIIKDVKVKVDDNWQQGVPSADGPVLPYTKANVVKLLLELPDMFRDIRQCAADANKYLIDQEAADEKNS